MVSVAVTCCVCWSGHGRVPGSETENYDDSFGIFISSLELLCLVRYPGEMGHKA